MKLETNLALAAVVALAACGGGGGGGTPAASVQPTGVAFVDAAFAEKDYKTARTFSDASGVSRGEGENAREIVMLPDVANLETGTNTLTPTWEAAVSEALGRAGSDFDRNFPFTQDLTRAKLRQGVISIRNPDGGANINLNVLAVQDDGGEAGLIFFDNAAVAGARILTASGTGYGSAPTGNHRYRGTMAMGQRLTGDPSYGDFVLGANFDDETFSFQGTAGVYTFGADGALNVADGIFASSGLLFADSFSQSGTIHGQFHGQAAESVSGVIHADGQFPAVAGGFVGTGGPAPATP